MAQNCSADVQTVIAHFDNVYNSGNESEFAALKARFGLEDLAHPDDVTGACELCVLQPATLY
jgi:hypothetical protein